MRKGARGHNRCIFPLDRVFDVELQFLNVFSLYHVLSQLLKNSTGKEIFGKPEVYKYRFGDFFCFVL